MGEITVVKFLRFLDEYFEEYVASLLFMLFSTLMMINIIMRYIFQDAIPWAEEIVLLIFVWFVWFAIPFATKKGNHARVTFVQDVFPTKIKALINILIAVTTIVLFTIIIVSAIKYLGHAAVKGKTGLLVDYPMWAFYIPAPIGLILTVYHLIRSCWSDISILIKPDAMEGQ